MSSPTTAKRHPACPGKSRCQLPSCIHNSPIPRFSTDEISHDLPEVNGMIGGYASVTGVRGGMSYQRLDAASELGTSGREIDDEPKATIGTRVRVLQKKIREVSGSILDRIRS